VASETERLGRVYSQILTARQKVLSEAGSTDDATAEIYLGFTRPR
jgi:hypothetical protein